MRYVHFVEDKKNAIYAPKKHFFLSTCIVRSGRGRVNVVISDSKLSNSGKYKRKIIGSVVENFGKEDRVRVNRIYWK